MKIQPAIAPGRCRKRYAHRLVRGFVLAVAVFVTAAAYAEDTWTYLSFEELEVVPVSSVSSMSRRADLSSEEDIVAVCRNAYRLVPRDEPAQRLLIDLRAQCQLSGLPIDRFTEREIGRESEFTRATQSLVNLRAGEMAAGSAIVPAGASFGTAEAVAWAADFIARRFKAEVIEYVAADYLTRLCDRKVAAYFPNACTLIDSGTLGQSAFSQIGSAFQKALSRDVRNLLPSYVKSKVPSPRKEILLALLAVYWNASEGDHPIGVLLKVAQDQKCDSKIQCGFRLAGIAAGAVLDDEGKWRKVDLDNPTQLSLLIDTAFAKFTADVKGDQWFKDNVREQEVRAWIGQVSPLVVSIGQLVDRLRAATTDDARQDLSILLVQRVADIFSAALSIPVNGDPPEFAEARKMVNALRDPLRHLQEREYGAFLGSVLLVTQQIFGEKLPLPENLTRYIPLIAALTSADSSEELTAAFEKYAMPVGGWRGKRAMRNAFTLGAMVGASGNDTHVAAFVPVGVDWTFGGTQTKNRRPWGLFLSVVDIGAPTAERIKDDGDASDEGSDDTDWDDVFSPGLYFRYSVVGPLVLGAGGALQPASDGDGREFRINAFIGVDVSLLPLYFPSGR